MTAAPETTVSAQLLGLLARDLPPDRLTVGPRTGAVGGVRGGRRT